MKPEIWTRYSWLIALNRKIVSHVFDSDKIHRALIAAGLFDGSILGVRGAGKFWSLDVHVGMKIKES